MKLHKAVVIAVALMCSVHAKAAIVSLTFEAIVVDGTFAGQSGVGSISYDDTNLPTDGEVFLGFPGGSFADFGALSAFSFSFLGQDYSEFDDGLYPDLPLLSLFDSFADSLDFFVEDGFGVDILEPTILDFQIFGDFLSGGLRDSNSGFDFEVDMFITERNASPVTTPSILIVLLLGVSIVFKRARQH